MEAYCVSSAGVEWNLENFFCSYYPFLEGFGQPFVEGVCMTKWWDDRTLKFGGLQISFMVISKAP